MKLRELIDEHGNVIKPPTMHFGDGKAFRETSAKIWMTFRESQVAQPYNEEDPYAREVGGLE